MLRQQTKHDAAFILHLLNDPAWLRYIGDRGVRTVQEARTYILNGAVAMYDEHGFGLYLMERKEDGAPVGVCGLVKRDYLDHVDLGYGLAAEHRGHGYAREAAAATMAYARDVIGLKRLAAIVTPDNTASVRLLEGLGFTFEQKMADPSGDAVHLFTLDL